MKKAKSSAQSNVYARAAKARALILAHLNTTNKKLTVKELVSELSDKFSTMGVTTSSIPYQMHRLAENKLIGANRRGVAMEYFKNDAPTTEMTLVDNVTPIKPTRKYTLREPSRVNPPTLSIDIVKSSGKVRINMNGIVLEVGIVD